MNEIYVIKFGGNAIRGKDDLRRLSKEIAEMVSQDKKIILVHGGGPEISDEMERRDLVPQKIAGLRITDDAVLEIAEEVLGTLNNNITDTLAESSVTTIGMPGYLCTVCKRKEPYIATEDGKEFTVDLGLVGEVAEVNAEMLYDLLEDGVTPVIYPIGEDKDGNRLNVNADTMAAGIAAGIDCKELITITDVPGILTDVNDPSTKINLVTLGELDDLIARGVIFGGMIPKVEACRYALESGVKAVRMVNGKDKRSILTDIMENIPHGTVIVK